MNNCPVGYNSNSSRYMVIENFSDKCEASLVPHDSSQNSNNHILNVHFNKNTHFYSNLLYQIFGGGGAGREAEMERRAVSCDVTLVHFEF